MKSYLFLALRENDQLDRFVEAVQAIAAGSDEDISFIVENTLAVQAAKNSPEAEKHLIKARSLSDLGLGADFCPFYLLLCWQNPHLARAKLRFCRLASGTEGETRSLRHQKSSGKPQTRQTPRERFSDDLTFLTNIGFFYWPYS